MSERIKLLGFAGSLRAGSYNRALLRAALELLPADTELELFELDGIPLFNQDLEREPPPTVRQFKEKIRAADALLIATPEYNYSVPGVLKNAIDWASRPPTDNAFEGKPVAVMGASTGLQGTARAQTHLRSSFVFLNMHPINRPGVLVGVAQERFDAQGRLTDGRSRALVAQLLENLVAWTRGLARAR